MKYLLLKETLREIKNIQYDVKEEEFYIPYKTLEERIKKAIILKKASRWILKECKTIMRRCRV